MQLTVSVVLLPCTMTDYIKEQLTASIEVKQKILNNDELLKKIEQLSLLTIERYKQGKKVLTAGNGGSAADAQHIAAELVSRFYFDRPGLPALALTTDTSILTAVGNDYGYHYTFARQIEANANEEDIFLGISTSGNSENILHAVETARKKNVTTVALTGEGGGKLKDKVDFLLNVPSQSTPRIQESHIAIGHILCAIVEKELFEK